MCESLEVTLESVKAYEHYSFSQNVDCILVMATEPEPLI